MARKLKEIILEEVSVVGKAANKKQFLFFKSEEDAPKWPSISEREEEENNA
jgi:hypothetical protein